MHVCVCLFTLAKGINFLFPVQTSTYDHIYEGDDVIVQASKHGTCVTLELLFAVMCY